MRPCSPAMNRARSGWLALAVTVMATVVCYSHPAEAQRPAGAREGAQAATPLVYAVLADRVRLRWDLPLQYPAGGYRLYRDGQLLTTQPLRPIRAQEAASRLSEDSGEAVRTYLEFLENPAQFPAADRAEATDTLQMVVLFRSIQDLEIAGALAILYDDTAVSPGHKYSYRLVAVDAQGGERELDTQTVSVDLTPSPRSPSGVALENTEDGRIGVRWQRVPPKGPRDPSGYNVYRSRSPEGPFERINANLLMVLSFQQESGQSLDSGGSLYFDEGLEDGQTFYYRVTGVDFFARESQPSEVRVVEFADRRPPLPVEKLTVQVTPTSARLGWIVPEDSRVATIQVLRSESIEGPFEQVGRDLPGNANSFTDDAVFMGRKYFYQVNTVSWRGVSAAFQPTTLAEILNPQPPAAPRNVKVQVRVGEVELSWAANPEPDLSGYRVYRALERDGEYELISQDVIHDLKLADRISPLLGNRFWYRVAAVNTSNAQSEKSPPIAATPPSIAAPDPPVLVSGPLTEGKIVLVWNVVESAVGYFLYRSILVGGEMLRVNREPLPARPVRYEDAQVDADTTYYYALQAVNERGIVSELSNIVSATTFRQESALAPTELRAEFNVKGAPPGVTLTWRMPGGQRLRCAVFRSESPDSSFRRLTGFLFEEQTRYTDTSATPGKTYYYVVQAKNPAGYVSPDSEALKVTVPPRAKKQ